MSAGLHDARIDNERPVLRPNRPNNSCELVGNRDGGDIVAPALFGPERPQPQAVGIGHLLRRPEDGYALYAMQNVQSYLEVIRASAGPHVLALSSGFMTYATDVHPGYARVRDEIAASATTLVLLPSLDYETCVAETVRRQLWRLFCRSAGREEEVIRQRFGVYRNLSAAKLETMKPISEVVEAAVVNLLPNIRLQPTAASAIMSPAAHRERYTDEIACLSFTSVARHRSTFESRTSEITVTVGSAPMLKLSSGHFGAPTLPTSRSSIERSLVPQCLRPTKDNWN